MFNIRMTSTVKIHYGDNNEIMFGQVKYYIPLTWQI